MTQGAPVHLAPPDHGPGAPLSIRLLPAAERPAAGQLWQALEARIGRGALACSWDWTETWLDHYGDLVPHTFAVAASAGEPCGIALLTRGLTRRGPFAIRSVHLGTAGEPPGHTVFVEYNRLLVAPERRLAFARALVDLLQRDPTWDELALDGFAPDDAEPLLQAAPALAVRRTACPAVDLDAVRAAGRDLIGALRASTRQKVRRSLRAFGPVETEWAERGEQALDVLEELIALHQQRWRRAGRPGAFSSARFAGFHRDLVPRLLPRGSVLLFRVRAAQGTIGCLYCLVEGGSVLFYQSGLASFADNRLKPGLVAHALCMQACLERGLREYNFLAGDERYKRELSTVERELVWATARRRRAKLIVLEGLRQVRRLLLRPWSPAPGGAPALSIDGPTSPARRNDQDAELIGDGEG